MTEVVLAVLTLENEASRPDEQAFYYVAVGISAGELHWLLERTEL